MAKVRSVKVVEAGDEEKSELSIPSSIIVEVPVAVAVLDTLIRLRAEVNTLKSEMEIAKGENAIVLARKFVALHFLSQCMTEANTQYDRLFTEFKRVVLPEAMERDGVTHVPLDEGFRVGVSSQLRASIKEGQREAAFEWLEANGFGSLITNTVNASTLAATARSMLEDEGRELPSDLFNAAYMATTSVTRTKK